MNKQAFIVIFSGLFPGTRVSISVTATDKNDARCIAIELAKTNGQTVGECLRVELA